MKMNPKVKGLWLAALRSGKYEQGSGELRGASNCFCCLGVLCDLKGDRWMRDWDCDPDHPFGYGSAVQYDLPPEQIAEWAGFDWRDAMVVIDGKSATLDEHNDHGRTFAEIADAIEAQL